MPMLRLPSKAMKGWASKQIERVRSASRRRTGKEGLPPESPQNCSAATVHRKSFILQHSSSRTLLEDVYNFVPGKELGAGGFGVVRRASLKGAETVTRAIKTVKKADVKAEGLVRREIAILRHIDHPCICRLLETFEDKKHIYLVLELIDGRELFDEIVEQRSLNERRASGIMRQVFGAVKYCHEKNIIHRDLKPENIMVLHSSKDDKSVGTSDGIPEVKLIDFGMATIYDGNSALSAGGSMMGSGDYLAPEASRGRCTAASDVWSVGMVLHAILVGSLPKLRKLNEGKSITEGGAWVNVSPGAKDLVESLLQVDPSKRLTAAEAANHAWTRGAVSAPLLKEHVNSMIENFTTFHCSAKLRRAALTSLAMQLTNKQLSEHREQFLAMDADGNGRISKQELVDSIMKMSPLCPQDVRKWAEGVFDSIDTDGSQEIDYTEWLAAAAQESTNRSEETLRAAFRAFDLDGDGRIDQAEFARVLKQTPEEVASLLPQFDADGDGVIDFEEFKTLMNSTAAGEPKKVSSGGSGSSTLPRMKFSL